jgi:octanoyl-[GcvH]:protein N-octanoyltransferase
VPHLRLITDSDPDPLVDTALSNAIMTRVAAGDIGPTLRLFVPDRVVAFGSQDRTRPGYADAVRAVRTAGFVGVERLAGGRAAVFHEGTIAFAWASPEEDSKLRIQQRFETIASIVLDALRRIELTGEIGETPGEYCPGRFSVHIAGRKVMGVGQRLVRGGAHVGGVLVVNSPDLVNRPLVPAYEALGYDWSPAATGSLADHRVVTIDQVMQALQASFIATGHDLVDAPFDPDTVSLARRLAPEHAPSIA